jgi:protein SCO1/2
MEEDKKTISKVTRIIIIFSVVIAALSLYILLAIDLPNKPLAGHGGNINDNVPIGGKFILTDQNGNKFDSDQMKGHLSLVYFGFTYCPDICPTSLGKLSNVISTLDKYQIDILPIFITIDPKRDTSALMKEYLTHFHPKFVGLTGSDDEIKRTAELYKVYYARSQNVEHASNNYMIDHSSFVYLMDKNGKYMKHFYISDTPEEIIEYIRVHK